MEDAGVSLSKAKNIGEAKVTKSREKWPFCGIVCGNQGEIMPNQKKNHPCS